MGGIGKRLDMSQGRFLRRGQRSGWLSFQLHQLAKFSLDRPPPRQIQSALQHQSVYVVPSLWRSHLRGTARWRDGCVHVAMPGGGRCPRPRRPGRFGHRQPRQATTPAPRASERQKRRPLCCCLAHLPLGLPRIHDFKPSSEARSSTRGPTYRRAGAAAVPRRRAAAHTLMP